MSYPRNNVSSYLLHVKHYFAWMQQITSGGPSNPNLLFASGMY
jgi:hypothetical protein